MKSITTFVIAFFMMGASQIVAEENSVNLLTNHPDVSFYFETDAGIPQYVSGSLAQGAGSGSEVSTAMAYFEEYKRFYRMNEPRNELVIIRTEEDRLGNQHLRRHHPAGGSQHLAAFDLCLCQTHQIDAHPAAGGDTALLGLVALQPPDARPAP